MASRAIGSVVAVAAIVACGACTAVSTPVNVEVVAPTSSRSTSSAGESHESPLAAAASEPEPASSEPDSSSASSSSSSSTAWNASTGVALPDADANDPQATCLSDFRCPSGSRFARIGSRGYCAVDGVSLPTPKTESYCAYLPSGTLAFYWTTKDGDPAYVCPSGMRDSINGEATFCLWENLAPPGDARPECGELRAHGWIGFSWTCPG
jgi:hypothetical protein